MVTDLIQAKTSPDLQPLGVVRWPRGHRDFPIQRRDPDFIRYCLIPVENLSIQLVEVLLLEIPNKSGLKVVNQPPDLGSQSRVGDHCHQIRVRILDNT
jgi:hypothetical protein